MSVRRLGAVTVLALAVALVVQLTVALMPPAGVSASPTPPASPGIVSASPPVSGFYLDIGASSALGVEPPKTKHNNGGYAKVLQRLEEAHGVQLTLKEVGCPGENSASILLTGDPSRIKLLQTRCYHGGPAQLAKAETYLRDRKGDLGVVSIDIGFNDVRPCLSAHPVNQGCFLSAMNDVRHDMPVLIADLKHAAGPHVDLIGMLYSDPFLADYLLGSDGISQANITLTDIGQLNSLLSKVYSKNGVLVADIPAAYKSHDEKLSPYAPYGEIPENLKMICEWTWMCSAKHDDHANNLGYTAEGEVMFRALSKVLR